MANILKAIKRVVETPIVDIKAVYGGRNRANSVVAALEAYVRDMIAGTFNIDSPTERNDIYSSIFSYRGNQNNPPDLILKGGDAIEIKKIESLGSSIALNSSYPKDKIYSDSPMITSECRTCEKWDVKDLIYVVGCLANEKLKTLWIVYGDCYAASKEIYERIRTKIAEGISEIRDVEFAKTKELGRVNRVDPLGITNLRIRGMWQIENPRKVFDDIHVMPDGFEFQVACIMKQDKYESFSNDDRNAVEGIQHDGFELTNIEIKNPNNPANLMNAKLITFNL